MIYLFSRRIYEKELSKVTDTIISYNNKIYEVTLENNEVIKSTEKHQYFVLDKGWVRAYDLKVGEYDKPIKTYNLTVDGIHNYLITEYEILVHNAPSNTI